MSISWGLMLHHIASKDTYEVRPTKRTRKGMLISTTCHVPFSCSLESIEFHEAGTIKSIEVVGMNNKTKSATKGCSGVKGESVLVMTDIDLVEGDRVEVIHDHDISITIRTQRV